MFRTCPALRLKAMPFPSVGTRLAVSLVPMPWSRSVDPSRLSGLRDGLGRDLQIPGVQGGSDDARVIGLHGQDPGGGFEVGFVMDQRCGSLVGGDADIFENERTEKEARFIGEGVEGLVRSWSGLVARFDPYSRMVTPRQKATWSLMASARCLGSA